MRGFLVQDGDLVLGQLGYAEISGATKVGQDLSFAIQEPYGCDRFHAGWGSLLSSMIGTAQTGSSLQQVQNEINRVVGNYINVQTSIIQATALANQVPTYTNDDVVSSIENIAVSQNTTTIAATLNVLCVSGSNVLLTPTVNS